MAADALDDWSSATTVPVHAPRVRGVKALGIGLMLLVLALAACTASPLAPTSASQPASETARPSALATPALPSASDGLSEEDAVSIAREAAPIAANGDVRSAQAGPLGEVFPSRDLFDWSRDLPADRWVWMVFLVNTTAAGDEDGAIVILDYRDGTVYKVMEGIS